MPAVTSDYFPTILQLVGAEVELNRPIDGISLTNLFDGKQDTRNRPIGFQSAKQLAWNAERYKLYSKDGGKKWELYDLQNDQRESKDIAAQHPEIVARMKKELETWRASCRRSDNGQDY